MTDLLSKVYPLAGSSKDTTVRQPREITCFSRDSQYEIHMDDSELSYYYLPDSVLDTNQGVDLQAGYTHFEKAGEDVGSLSGLLKAVEFYERQTGKKTPVSVITWRGLMRQLMMLPYENRDRMVLNVVVYDGQFFIQTDVATMRAQRSFEETTRTEQNLRQIYSGYKFEAVSTLKKPWPQCSRKQVEKRFKRKVSNVPQYCSVVRTAIGKAKLLIGAEVDCAWDYKPDRSDVAEGEDHDPLKHYVELKTTGVIDSPKSCNIFERKLLRTWAQCFLAGIPRVIYGFRDDNMVLRSVEEFKTEEIPVVLRDGPFQRFQNGSSGQKPPNKCMHCLRFFSGIINWIIETVPRDDESKTFRIEYDPSANKSYVMLKENESDVTAKLLSEYDGADGGMLTQEFKRWREELTESA